MLFTSPERPSAALPIDVVSDLQMIPPHPYDISFLRQIGDIDGGRLGLGAPDAYAVTLRSAVPVADTLRGFFEAGERECPPLLGLETNKAASTNFYRDAKSLTAAQDAHVAELTARFGGADHICIVEQFVSTGQTLGFGAHMLGLAGVKRVSAIRGSWYHETQNHTVDVDGLTSYHGDQQAFMRGVGRLAAKKLSLQTN